MDRVFASMERLKALWLELEQTKPKTPKYEALMKQIRAESMTYMALVESETTPRNRPE
jgi:hypothetical protein